MNTMFLVVVFLQLELLFLSPFCHSSLKQCLEFLILFILLVLKRTSGVFENLQVYFVVSNTIMRFSMCYLLEQ